jgi:hypothetical protein
VGAVVGGGGIVKIEDSEIDGSKATGGNGGGMYVTQSGNGKLKIDTLNVKNCEAKSGTGKGGGIYLSSTDEDADISIEGLTFENNVGGIGKDMYVIAASLSSLILNKFTFAVDGSQNPTTSKGYDLFGTDLTNTSPVDLYMFLLVFQSSPFFLDQLKGRTAVWCGMASYPCTDFASLLLTDRFVAGPRVINIAVGAYTQGVLDIGTYNFKYVGAEQANTKISFNVTNAVIFAVGARTLELNTLTLLLSASHTASLITLGTGSLTIISCTMKRAPETATFSSSLIVLSGGTTIIRGSTIGPVSVTGFTGGGISGSYSAAGSSLEVSGGEMDTCVMTAGDGGGVYVYKTGRGTVNISSETFKDCSASGSGKKGGGIYLEVD